MMPNIIFRVCNFDLTLYPHETESFATETGGYSSIIFLVNMMLKHSFVCFSLVKEQNKDQKP